MRNFKKVAFLVFLILMFLSLNGCDNNENKEDEKIKEKVIEELAYLDSKILDMMNELNNISLENYEVSSDEITTKVQSSQGSEEESSKQSKSDSQSKSSENANSEENSEAKKITVSEMKKNFVIIADLSDINWDNIKSQIELLNSSWSIIALDLYSLNVEKEDVLYFSTILNKAIINIKAQDKPNALITLSEMYSYIPKYLKAISAENSLQNIKQTKSYIINAYAFVEQGNWTEVNSNLDNAISTYNNVISDANYAKKNEYKVNKTYILINDLKNSISNEDVEMFFIKYKNVIQGLNIM